MFLAEPPAKLAGQFAHHRHTRVAFLINAVAETHDFFFARQSFPHPRLGAIGRADLAQHLHGFLIGAAVERSLERAQAGRDGCVHVRHGRGRHARRKRGGVELVIGIKHQDGVHDFSPPWIRLLAGQAGEKVRSVAEVGRRQHRRQGMRDTPARGDERRDLRDQACRLAEVGGMRVVVQVRVERREHRHAGA